MADYVAEARRAAARAGIDPNVFVRQIRQESGFNPGARSPAGAVGIAQFMPSTAAGLGINPNNPVEALNGAAKLMRSYVDKFGSYRNALIAYNAGPGAVGKGLPAETTNYIKTILGGSTPATPTSSRSPSEPATGTTQQAIQALGITLPQRPQLQFAAPNLPSFAAKAAGTAYPQFQTGKPQTARPRFDVNEALSTLAKTQQATQPQTQPASSQPSSKPSTGGVHGSGILELIYNDGGKGYGIKNGQTVDGSSVFSSVWDGHKNHVHVAAGPKTTVEIGRVAQQMGLHVGENPHFGGVDPVHVPGSYHYKGEAIDVSGDPKKMSAFARWVQNYQRAHG